MPDRRIAKIWLIMRSTIVLLIAAIMQVSAAGYAQKVTLSKSKAPLQTVLKEIRQQTGMMFLSTESLYAQAKPVNINVNNTDLKEVLDLIFANQPLTYAINENTVTIKARETSLLDNLMNRLRAIKVFGKVVDPTGNPLVGATIVVKGSVKSTTTNTKGEFTLSNVDEDAVLQISFIGYLTREVNATADLRMIRLEFSNSKLDEVQVIAYGTTSRRLSTGNISTVKADEIAKQPVANPLLALQGRVPSLQITQTSGVPGSGMTVRIQGANSLKSGNDPFYVVDGIPFTSQMLPNLGSGILRADPEGKAINSIQVGGGNPFNFINPADIESIDVLKDADATAIYGSRAANGAILITTKNGKAGSTNVDVNMQQGFGQVAKKIKMMNTQEYLDMRRRAYANSGQPVPTSATLPSSSNYDLTLFDQNRNTDWQEELIGGTASYTDVQAAVSGGNATTTFRVNGGYHRETTVFPGSSADVKGSFSMNINHRSANNKFGFQASASYMSDKNNLINSDLTSIALSIAPNAPALYQSDGSLNWQKIKVGTDSVSTWLNPLAILNNSYVNKTNNLIANGLVSYKILPGLELRSSFGFNALSSNETIKNKLSSKAPELRASNQRSANYGTNNSKSWIIEPQLNYSKSFEEHKINVLLGTTFQENDARVLRFVGQGFINDGVMDDIKSAPTTSIGSTVMSIYKYTSIFGRVNYTLSDTYIANITFRRDGSSRFGTENQFHNFGAVGLAWIFSNENLISRTLPFLSFGKIRGSYGTTGNDQIGDYQYLDLYQSAGFISTAYQGNASIKPGRLNNPYLQWESTKKLQFGIDLGFIKDRILFNANYFQNRSSNQLLQLSLPSITGFAGIDANLPATVQNTGWEFSVTTNNIQKKELNWTTSFNLTIPKNELVRFDNLETSSSRSQYIIGLPIDISKSFSLAGVDPQTGDYQFFTSTGAKTFAPSGSTDNIFIFSKSPKFYGGLQNSLSFNGFSVDFIFQFVKQIGRNILGVSNNMGQFFGGNSNSARGNLPSYLSDYWKQVGENNLISRPTTSFSNNRLDGLSSNLIISDASFIRLKNASLSYSLPRKLTERISVQNIRLFVQGQNLLTITHYKGLDPENQTNLSLPPLRVFTTGLQVTF